ncbi:asparagine synthase (glutamine-hydrolysing) [Stackebrandtia albiflava]|uniref:asparagine synthase (glutamine-hydrolyzing) n=1 Tax=Stackebrandtia albiflava TaxID=406432 RepID=A0A562V2R6_9ACTN|nr:asparagine synthase (glutamine-hydrolyzing) [Stackebrandtia albiflava]TWJ12161.1 asparagine synthase (glutamine-hydrolysing) [Stackebrandtia albiflava]
MCGIGGYVGFIDEDAMPMLRRMADAMVHRGPDGEGYAVGRDFGLAHRRLAVIDRETGDQPMWSPDGRYAIVYNGEVYNFRELRYELTTLGYEFTTNSDTEVVLIAWRHWNDLAFDKFNGMFALAIADTESGKVVLARDQFGIKPLYIAQPRTGTVVFGSEFRPIFASHLVPREPDDVTVYRYLRFRVHDDTERTFFRGVTRLLPGERAVITPDGVVQRDTYTRLYSDLAALASKREPYEARTVSRFDAELRTAIRRRLVADVPVGTALSGGLDSSTVVAVTNQLLTDADRDAAAVGSRQQTFSAVFPGQLNDEERYVDALAARCRHNLRVHKVNPHADRFLADMSDFILTQEEPVISTGPYAQYCVMREASRHVTVMIDGQGADEMMAGYVPYHLVYLRQLWRRGQRGRALRELAGSLDVLWRLGRFSVADRLHRRSRVPVTGLLNRAFARRHHDERFDVIDDDLKARLQDDIFRHSLQSLLRYEDRNTMRFSVEGRVPFLDANLLRHLWRHDDSMIIRRGWNKRALRDATRALLPPVINRRRNKIGFTTPEEAWFLRMKNSLHEIFTSESFGRRRYFDQAAVVRAFRAYLAGRASAETMTFWRLLNVELWMRTFIDQDPNAIRHDIENIITDEGSQPGMHPQAPPKSDFTPNEGKDLVTADGRWVRYPLRCDLVGKGDSVTGLAGVRVARFFAGLPTADAAAVAPMTTAQRWYLFVSEKIVAISQGRSYFTWEIHPGWWARRLARHVVKTPYGIGLGDPTTMQLAIDEVGLGRILVAAVASAAGKAMGRRGLFYDIVGPSVRAIDGPTEYSAYPANVSAKLAPADPSGVARRISAALRATLPDDVIARFGGTVVIDANDIGRNILGHDTGLSEPALTAAFADNPLGQGRQQTPLAVVATGFTSEQVPAGVGAPLTSTADRDRQDSSGVDTNRRYRDAGVAELDASRVNPPERVNGAGAEAAGSPRTSGGDGTAGQE